MDSEDKFLNPIKTPWGEFQGDRFSGRLESRSVYTLQVFFLFVSALFGKHLYMAGTILSIVTILIFKYHPINRFFAWKISWYTSYFILHLGLSIVAGWLIGSEHDGLAMLWVFANFIFMLILIKELKRHYEDLMEGHIDFSDYPKPYNPNKTHTKNQ